MDLRDLKGDVNPPPGLKARVEKSLRERGVLRQGQRRRWLPLAAVLAGVVLMGAGYMMGRGTSDGAGRRADGAFQYALLLYVDSNFTRAVPESALVAEYNAWGQELAARGILVGGEKLGRTAGRLGAWATNVPREGLSGFFMIAAPSDSVAVSIANSCPHLRHGGRIAVRRIDPT